MSPIDTPEEISPEHRRDLADWLLAMIDNKKLLGMRYAEWCTGAPELEADIAVTAMAQYELGHARLLDGLLSDLPEDPRTEDRQTDPTTWRSLPFFDRPLQSWTEIVVANGLIDGLLTVNLEAGRAGAYRPLAQRLRKAVAEERYHRVHGRAWIRRIAGGPEERVEELREDLRRAWPQCIGWFGPPARESTLDRLADAGVLDAGSDTLRQRYLDEIVPLFDVDPLESPARREGDRWLIDDIDWSGWTETHRRHGVPDFDEDSFRMLTGEHARAMGVRD